VPNGAAFPWPHPWHAPDARVSGTVFVIATALAAGTAFAATPPLTTVAGVRILRAISWAGKLRRPGRPV